MADQGQGLQRPPRRALFLGHRFVSRFQRHCDTRRIYNVGLDPQLVSFVAMGRPGACLSFARDVIHDDDSSSCISTTDCLILQIGENDNIIVFHVNQSSWRAIFCVLRATVWIGETWILSAYVSLCTALLHCHPVRGALLDTHYASATMA